MKLDCVFTAVNENKLYLDFIPIFIKTWNKLYPDVDVKIVLIAKDIPEDLILYKNNIILFNPIEDVLTSFTSQFIRLLYPCILDYKNGVLITDMDMLPMNSTYYTKNIVEFDNNKFIYYRDNVCFEYKQIAMCYNVATPKIWKDIFKVNSIDDIANVIKDTFIKNTIKEGHGNTGWSIDQITLYNKIMEWNKKTNNFIRLKEKQTQFKRLDRNTFDIANVNIRENITSGKYTDYHCYRPMSKYSKINWELFNLLPSAYSTLPFIKSELKSPIGNGLFEILINTKENILYKKKKKKINFINIENYKKIIYGIKSNPVLCEYIFEPEKIYIENDGSYYSSFIKNSIRLYDINSNSRIDDTILDNLKRSIQDMKKKLNNYVKINKLSGDWALHNLIYCLDTNKIYNVDLEGFYTYPLIHDNGNCDINYCNERFDKLLKIMDKLKSKMFVLQINDLVYNSNEITMQEKVNEYFTLILWNPTLFQAKKILEYIPNIIEKKEIVVPKESLHNYIFDIYKLDTRCSHNIVLPPKIQKLKEYDDKHLVVKFKIDKPQYTNNICNQAVQLKEMIRRKYKSYIKNYIKDIMIHVADNFEQSKYIWEKKIYTINMLRLLIQEAKNPLRYKISKTEKNGKDGWNTINTINAYESFIEGTEHFFVYWASNPSRYCLSKEKITDNNWEYYYDFYCKESEVDRRIPMNIVENSQKYITGNNFKRICDFCINNNKLVPINNNILKPFYGCFIFVRCGQERYFFKNVFNSIKTPFYIVTHNSDSSSPKECYKYLDNDKIIKWYCKNNDYDKYHHKLELIPLGLGNTRDKNILHQIYEKKKSFENKKYPYKCLISSNFSTYNGKTHSRTICYESLKNKSFIEIMSQRLNYAKYLKYILDYGFIISPHGNGLDCTRTWESILLGLIPIVKSSTLDILYTNLPVMIVNDWNEITLDKLKNFKNNCKIKERYDLLYTYFWDNKFKNDRIFINNYIPKIIHQTYSSLDNLRSDYKKYSDGIKKLHFDYKYYFWSDEDMYNFVKIEYPHLYQNYMSLPKKIYQIDIFKYLIIHNKGGIFIDMDYEFYKSLSPYIENKHVFMPVSHEKGSLNCNSKQGKLNINSNLHPSSLLGSIKNYPLWIDLVEQILKDQDYNNNNGDAIFVTGPHILSKFLYENRNKYDSLNEKNNYNVSNEKYKNTDKQVGIHHCTGTWRNSIGDCYKNVKPIKQIFDKLTNYVVLRGHDDLHKRIPLLKNSDDIDILLTEKNDLIKLCGNNIVVINNERIKFDRRYIGDNYYDSKWQQNMIATKVNRHFFYVLDEQNNYYATLYHSLIHKGQIHNKYEKLYKNFENKHKLNSDILSRYYQLLKFMLRNNYTFTRAYDRGVGFFKNKYKLNLFIIRKKGMEREIIENILTQIENEYQILDKILININNKKKFYSNFYGNYDKHKDDIEKNNDNQCLAIITNNPDDINPNELKQKIRKQYIKFYPPLGNIIHSSDSSNDCEKELEMLFNENIDNFKNIGTYYSQKKI